MLDLTPIVALDLTPIVALVRFNIGLESVDDLIADIAQAFEKMALP